MNNRSNAEEVEIIVRYDWNDGKLIITLKMKPTITPTLSLPSTSSQQLIRKVDGNDIYNDNT